MQGNLLLPLLVLLPVIGGLAVYIGGEKNEKRFYFSATTTAAVVFLLTAMLSLNTFSGGDLRFSLSGAFGFGLGFSLSGVGALFALLAAFLWLTATVFSREYLGSGGRRRYYLLLLLTESGTLGVFLAADLLMLLFFFELMSVCSALLVAEGEGPAAQKAARTTLAVAILGGALALAGTALAGSLLGTLNIGELYDAAAAFSGNRTLLYAAGGLLLFGFGSKAGIFPLHFWLPGAHAAAPAPASALLSGILTKTGIYALLLTGTLIFPGDESFGLAVLIFGVLGMLSGAVRALFSTNLKETLAFSSISQIGFILLGIGLQGMYGIHNSLAVHGVMVQIITHALAKLLLFSLVGVAQTHTRALELDGVCGFGRGKVLFTGLFGVASLALSGVPFLSGYVGKTLLHEAIVEKAALLPAGGLSVFIQGVEWIFILTSALTAAYMLKLFVALCVERSTPEQQKNFGETKHYISGHTVVLLSAAALLLVLFGVIPSFTERLIAACSDALLHTAPAEHPLRFFAWENLRATLLSLSIGALVYLFIIRKLVIKKNPDGSSRHYFRWPKTLDFNAALIEPLFGRALPALRKKAQQKMDVRNEMRASAASGSLLTTLKLRRDAAARKTAARYDDATAESLTLASLRRRYDSTVRSAEKRRAASAKRLRGIYALFENRRNSLEANLPAKVHARFDRARARTSAAGTVIWDGEGNVFTAIKRLCKSEKQKRVKPFTGTLTVYDVLLHYTTEATRNLRALLRIPDMPYTGSAQHKDSALRNAMIRSMFSSLASTFFLYLLVFVVILLVIL